MVNTHNETVVAVYPDHDAAEASVRRLLVGGIKPDKLSIISKDSEVREDVQGYHPDGNVILKDVKEAGWIGGAIGLYTGIAFLFMPGIGPLVVLGPLACVLGGAASGAGVGFLMGTFEKMGVPKDHSLEYVSHLHEGKFVVIIHSTAEDALLAKEIMQRATTPA